MVDGKKYLIIKKQEKDGHYPVKLAYWYEERRNNYCIYKEGFYNTQYFLNPHKNVIKHIDMNDLPKFTEWKIEEPIEGEKYYVYRVGSTKRCPPHYTIRRYHNGSFGSADVKYWIKLSDLLEHEF